jgi:hypothetical protein
VTTLETWALIVALIVGPGLTGYLIGRAASRRPLDKDDTDLAALDDR